MTRVLVQRGSAGSPPSSNQNRSASSSASTSTSTPSTLSSSACSQHQGSGTAQVVPTVKDEKLVEVQELGVLDELSDNCAVSDNKNEDISLGSLKSDWHERGKSVEDETMHNDGDDDVLGSVNLVKGFEGMVMEGETDATVGCSTQKVPGSSYPPPPPAPPSSPSADPSSMRMGPSGRASVLPGVSIRSSPTGSRPSSPRSLCEVEGYNSADEQGPCFSSRYNDAEREHQFEIDLRRVKGLEVRKMLEDGNCLFRAVADQVYGDSELYNLVRGMCIDYMERERDHFSQFITEGFTSYCKRKRRDKVYGNNAEIQALSEMYNRPIHIYSDSTEPINIFHGSYNTDTPPIRLSYHHGNHYNSLVDPRRLSVGAGLGFSSLQGTNIDKDKVKAAINAQQDQQIDNALLAEGRFYSDLEMTEKEIERMVMETSRAEYLSSRESSTSRAEPSSSAARSETTPGDWDSVPSGSMQVLLSMGFSYLQVLEAYNIFGDDVDSMICYLIETNSSARNKGKATQK